MFCVVAEMYNYNLFPEELYNLKNKCKCVYHFCVFQGADFRQAIRACKIWCWIETFRMIIFVYTFLVDVYQQSFNGRQYVITIPETIIMIFAWFFVNEYKKELSFQWGCQLPMMSQQMNGFQPPQVIYYPPSIPTSNVYNYNYQY